MFSLARGGGATRALEGWCPREHVRDYCFETIFFYKQRLRQAALFARHPLLPRRRRKALSRFVPRNGVDGPIDGV
jgi:hypothetical protein